MKSKLLSVFTLLLMTTSCFVGTTNDGPAVASGTLRLDWTIDGSTEPSECQQGSVASLNVIITRADGRDAGEYSESCRAMAASIDLPPGAYDANAVLLDSSGRERTTEIAIARFLITRDTETSIPIDFPADSSH